VFLQLSSEQFVGDVWIAQLDRKRVPQTNLGLKSVKGAGLEMLRIRNAWVYELRRGYGAKCLEAR